MSTQFRSGYSFVTWFFENWKIIISISSLNKNKNVKMQGMTPPNKHQMSGANLLWQSLLFNVIQFALGNQLYFNLLLVLSFLCFNIAFWTRLLKLCVHVICCISSHYTTTWEICNLIGLEQWYFQLFLKYLHVKITILFRVVV